MPTPPNLRWAQAGWVRGQLWSPTVGPGDEFPIHPPNSGFLGRYYEIRNGATSGSNNPTSIYVRRFFSGRQPLDESRYSVNKITQSSGTWQIEIPGVPPLMESRVSGWTGRVLQNAGFKGEVNYLGDRIPGFGSAQRVIFSNCVHDTETATYFTEFAERTVLRPSGNVFVSVAPTDHVSVPALFGDQFAIWDDRP